MSDRNKQGEPICEFSDLPVVMCAHCSGKTAPSDPVITINRRCDEPVPARGQLGLWTLPDDVEQAVRRQL